MKKLLQTAACLALLLTALAAAPSLEAAECAAAVPLTPASLELSVDVPASAPAAEAASLATDSWVDPALLASGEIQVVELDFEFCRYWACTLTPTGCGCAGFYCNGEFICGYRIKP